MFEMIGYAASVIVLTYIYLWLPVLIIGALLEVWLEKGGVNTLIPDKVTSVFYRIIFLWGKDEEGDQSPAHVANLFTSLGSVLFFSIVAYDGDKYTGTYFERIIEIIHTLSTHLDNIFAVGVIGLLVWFGGIYAMRGISWVHTNIEKLKNATKD